MMKKLMFVCAIAMAITAFADSTWTDGSGDHDLANKDNWSDGVPTGGNANFNAPIGSILLKENLTINGAAMNFNGTGDIVLDLGAANTFTVGYRTFVKPGAKVILKSGTYQQATTGGDNRFFIGDNCSDGMFIVDGSDAKLLGSSASGGSGYIEVGSGNGTDSKDNLLKVMNGGYLGGWVVIGRLANGNNRSYTGTNTVWITGLGSKFVSNANVALDVGCQQGLAHLVVDDGATAQVGQSLRLGVRYVDGGRNLAGAANVVQVKDTGSTMTVAGDAVVGFCSHSNVLEVAGGGSLTVSGGLYSSQEYNTGLTNGMLPFDNVVRATGEGSSINLNGGMQLGCASGSRGDALEVQDGASVAFGNENQEYGLGGVLGSEGNRVLVDDATLNAGSCQVYIGKYGDGNSLIVTNGGVVTCNNMFHVGYCSASNVLEVAAGGTFTLEGQLRAGWNNRADGTKPGGNKIWVHGKDAKLSIRDDVRLDRLDGQIGNQFIVEDGGFFECRGGFHSPFTQEERGHEDIMGFSSNLLVRVTGEGSRFVLTHGQEFLLAHCYRAGTTNVNATVYVADGGELSVSNGNCMIAYGNGNALTNSCCERNWLHIGPGGKFRQTIQAASSISSPVFRLGNNPNAKDNGVKIEGDFRFVNSGAARADIFQVGVYGASNRFEVVNGGKATIDSGGFMVGAYAMATDCSALIEGAGSELCITNTEYIAVGNGGPRASLTVDGGRLDVLGSRMVIGSSADAAGCWSVVKNGGVINAGRIVLGDKAPDCSLTVDDATLNIVYSEAVSSGGYLDMGYTENADPANATLRIRGRDAKVRLDKNIRMRNATAKIVFEVPAEGFADTPFVSQGGFDTVAAGASIHVTAAADWPEGSKVKLVECTNTGKIADLTLTCDEGLRIRRVGNTIFASKPGGFVIIFR